MKTSTPDIQKNKKLLYLQTTHVTPFRPENPRVSLFHYAKRNRYLETILFRSFSSFSIFLDFFFFFCITHAQFSLDSQNITHNYKKTFFFCSFSTVMTSLWALTSNWLLCLLTVFSFQMREFQDFLLSLDTMQSFRSFKSISELEIVFC